MNDRIEKVIELAAPVARVWQALTDHREFGQWFRVDLDGPFEAGAVSTGSVTHPGFEGWPWRATVERMDAERLFSFRWPVFDEKTGVDGDDGLSTLVEFHLESTDRGTRLTIRESGFDAIPDPRGLEVLRRNTQGWEHQSGNLTAHVAA